MVREVSAGGIVFRRDKEIKYLLLHKEANNNYKESLDFPKSNVEKGES